MRVRSEVCSAVIVIQIISNARFCKTEIHNDPREVIFLDRALIHSLTCVFVQHIVEPLYVLYYHRHVAEKQITLRSTLDGSKCQSLRSPFLSSETNNIRQERTLDRERHDTLQKF